MRLVAIYIKKHFLFSESQIINLGGKYIYDVIYIEENKYEVIRRPKPNHIENFWQENISLVSAIVGENGTGKTSIFRNLNNLFSPYDKQEIIDDAIYIFENLDDENFSYYSENLEINEINKIKKNEIETIYYSPAIDYDLVDINSPISMTYHLNESLFLSYIQNIQRHLFFLKNTELIENLKQSYSKFPFYEKLTIKANKLYKDDFERIYIHTTLGNNFYRVRNDLMNLVKNRPYCFNNEEEVEKFFNSNKGIQDELKAIWNLYKNDDENESHLLHNGKNFIKNLEINILSFLVINDTFPLNGDNGSYDFNRIIESENFIEKLDHFFNKFIIQNSKTFYNILGENPITVENSDLLLEILHTNPELNHGRINEFNIQDINKLIKNYIIIFKNIYDFYNQIQNFLKKDYVSEIEGGIEIDITKLEINDFNTFIKIYETLQVKLADLIPIRSGNILEIKSTKKHSTGEKSLLDLYSSIYEYLNRFGDHQYNKNCIFLLDEADLGFHPEWKRKYIKAITKTLPTLINIKQENIKNLQIIFATHDPLTLSDIPNTNVVYLKKDEDKTRVLRESEKPKKSFGANITDLLADSFFINDGLIGDFAKEKIEKVIEYLNNKESLLNKLEAKKIINIIDEPILKNKLESMYYEKFPKDFDNEKEIQDLMKRAKQLGLKIQE